MPPRIRAKKLSTTPLQPSPKRLQRSPKYSCVQNSLKDKPQIFEKDIGSYSSAFAITAMSTDNQITESAPFYSSQDAMSFQDFTLDTTFEDASHSFNINQEMSSHGMLAHQMQYQPAAPSPHAFLDHASNQGYITQLPPCGPDEQWTLLSEDIHANSDPYGLRYSDLDPEMLSQMQIAFQNQNSTYSTVPMTYAPQAAFPQENSFYPRRTFDNFYQPIQSLTPAMNVPPLIFDHSSPEEDFEQATSPEVTNLLIGTAPNTCADGEELVGVGLYNSGQPPRSLTLGATFEGNGKGLKLEETWQPPGEATRQHSSAESSFDALADGEGNDEEQEDGNDEEESVDGADEDEDEESDDDTEYESEENGISPQHLNSNTNIGDRYNSGYELHNGVLDFVSGDETFSSLFTDQDGSASWSGHYGFDSELWASSNQPQYFYPGAISG